MLRLPPESISIPFHSRSRSVQRVTMLETTDTPVVDKAMLERMISERVDAIFADKLEAKLAEFKEARTPSMTIIATKGTLDWAYPPFILASTAAALGWNVSVFFTFYGLE